MSATAKPIAFPSEHAHVPDVRRRSFYLLIALSMSFTAFFGFWFTYFGPISRGEYPPVSPMVHVHGLSFLAWFLLLPAQAGLIRSDRIQIHRIVGACSTVLAAIMVLAGLTVVGVQADLSLAADASPFWVFMVPPIFSALVLFIVLYIAALSQRRRAADHKRLILLASSAPLAAATFRVLVAAFGFKPWVWVVGFFASNLFVIAAMAYDYRVDHKIHRVYRYGLPVTLGLEAGAFLVAITPAGVIARQGLAWFGRLLRPLY
ncbi:MAG: hypothetical protein L0Z53_22745 [Acidobacteriales bacterium]|nr:hypothetical protein [Terriglobales bacterium]